MAPEHKLSTVRDFTPFVLLWMRNKHSKAMGKVERLLKIPSSWQDYDSVGQI